MRMSRVVLAQEVLAVVIAIRRTHDCVHMIVARQIGTVQGNRRLVIKFDHDHRYGDIRAYCRQTAG